jgi:hypothetical protein
MEKGARQISIKYLGLESHVKSGVGHRSIQLKVHKSQLPVLKVIWSWPIGLLF